MPLTTGAFGITPGAALVRPGKGVHVYFDRRLTNFAILTSAIDGRQVFVEPWQNMTVIGTTDDDFYGDLDDCVATHDEVRYLVQAAARVFPKIAEARAIGTWAGVRPTIHAWGPNEDALSREHQVIDHGAEQGAPGAQRAPGLFSLVGGKLASFRLFAEEATDVVARELGSAVTGTTHVEKLPGGDVTLDPLVLAEAHQLDATVATRLEYRHGGRALRIIERMEENPRERALVCACEPVTEAEVRHAVAHEWARTVDDVARRTRLGLGACGGMRCAARCGAIVAEMTDQSPAAGRRLALDFLRTAARRRMPVLGPEQAPQEALLYASVQASLGLSRGEDKT
jgi:glycerol-3-phosphate dehydrogenase